MESVSMVLHCCVCFQGQNVLTETLLRAQERQATDQPDLPQEVPADSSEQGDQAHQRARVSSSDFEPFEVIDEVEGKGSRN